MANIVGNAHPPPYLHPHKRRPGRTSRSAMKPTFTSIPKNSKNPNHVKANQDNVDLPMATKRNNGEEGEKEALIVLSSSSTSGAGLGPCDYGYDGYNCNKSINDDDGVLCFSDDIFDTCFLPNESEAVKFPSESNNLEDSKQKKGLSASSDHENIDTMADDFIDWDFVCRDGQSLYRSFSSWLLDGESLESDIRQKEPNRLGELLDLDEENAMVAWLLS